MKSRLATLVLLVIAAWALYHYAEREDAARRPPAEGGLLFPGLEPRSVDFLGMTLRGGHPLELERDEKGYWKITYPTDEEAQQELVAVVVDNLSRAAVVPVEAMGQAIRAEDVGLEPPLFKITFGSGPSRRTIFLGEFAPLKEGVYARLEGSDEIVLVTANLRTMVEQFRNQDYVDKHLLRGIRGPVTHLRVARPDGLLFDAARTGDTWTLRAPVSGPADGDRIQQVVRALSFAEQTYVAGVTDRDYTEQELRELGFPTRSMAAVGDWGEATMIEMGTDGAPPVRAFLQKDWQNGENDIYALRGDFVKLLVVERNDYSMLRNDTDFFRDHTLLPPVRERARRVRVEVGGEARLDMRMDARGVWTFSEPTRLAGVTVDSTRVDGRSLLGEFLQRLDGLRAVGFSDAPPTGEPDARLVVGWDLGGSERTDRIELYGLGAPISGAILARSTQRLDEGLLLSDDVRALLAPDVADGLRSLTPLAVDASRWGGFEVTVPGLDEPLTISRPDATSPWSGDDPWGRRYELAFELSQHLRGSGWRARPEGATYPGRVVFRAFDGDVLASLDLRLPGRDEPQESRGEAVALVRCDVAPTRELEVPRAFWDALVRLTHPEERR